jgi:outer membrane protein OmpA-like peptidoglycan-associated protein
MARQQLTDLLQARGNQEETVKVGEPPTVVEAAPAAATPIEAVPETAAKAAVPEPREKSNAPARARSAARTKVTRPPARPKSDELPPYLTFERKEARLRPDQVTLLNVKARELNKTKNPDADRITDNTLIRVAVDLILARANELRGGDETQLRKSLGL